MAPGPFPAADSTPIRNTISHKDLRNFQFFSEKVLLNPQHVDIMRAEASE